MNSDKKTEECKNIFYTFNFEAEDSKWLEKKDSEGKGNFKFVKFS